MNQWRVLSLISINLIFIIVFILIKKNKRKEHKITKESYNFTRNNFIENYLKESGISYDFFIILNIILVGLFMSSFIVNFVNFQFANSMQKIWLMLLCIILMNIYIYAQKMKFRKELLKDLINTHHVMYWQSRINTEDEKSITYASQKLKSPLKQELIELAGCYRLRRDVLLKLKKIRELSNLEELQLFTHMLEQKFKTGMTEDYHKLSLNMLKRLRTKEHEIKKMKTKNEIIVYTIILSGLFTIIIAGPILLSAFSGFENIIRY